MKYHRILAHGMNIPYVLQLYLVDTYISAANTYFAVIYKYVRYGSTAYFYMFVINVFWGKSYVENESMKIGSS